MLSKNAVYLLQQRYSKNGESAEGVFKRVAGFLSEGDFKFEDTLQTLMMNGVFLPNSPCLFNAGIPHGMLHACFILPVHDDIHSIFNTVSNMAYIFKGGGGVGINFSYLRERDAQLSGGGSSSGVLSFMKIFDHVVDTVKQGGMRRGALMGILDFNHPEIYNFIKVKLEGKLQNFNLSIMVTDEFMNAVLEDRDIDVVSPKNGIVNRVGAKDIFDVACFASWVNGDPAFLFYDRINKDNPFYPEVKINTVNPCSEVAMPHYSACIAKGELVKTKNGHKPIEEIVKGEKVLSRTEKGNWCWTNVLENLKQGRKKVYSLELSNDMTVKATEDHKILTDKGWKELKDITIDDSVFINNKIDNLPIIKNKPIDDYDMFGWFTGDGWFSEDSCGLVFGIDDVPIVDDMISQFNSFCLSTYEKKVIKKEGYSDRFQVAGYRKDIFEKFKDRGFVVGNAIEKEIPKQLHYWSTEQKLRYVRGLFSADGSVSYHKSGKQSVNLASSSYILLKQVQTLLIEFGLQSTINWWEMKNRKNPQGRLTISGESARTFMDIIGFLLEYKNEKFQEYKRFFRNKDYIKVDSISYIGEEETFDLVLDSVHNFLVNGIVVHNCCLGSINVAKFVWRNEFNFERFADVCKTGMRALTAMNRLSEYPLPEITEAMNKYNPVGLGIMGFADCLIKLGIRYDSQECLDFIDKLGSVYKEASLSYNPDMFYFYRRIIAPTGSLSILADCSSGVEPVYDTAFERSLTIGKIEEVRDLYKSEYVRTSHEISPEWHVKVLAKWQEYLDGGCSKTINMPNNASVEDIKNAYITAWKMGVKGITVYRDGSRDQQVLYSKPSTPKVGKCSDETCTL